MKGKEKFIEENYAEVERLVNGRMLKKEVKSFCDNLKILGHYSSKTAKSDIGRVLKYRFNKSNTLAHATKTD